jgi:uncharacterized membrane protein
MKNKTSLMLGIVGIISLIPMIYLAAIYPTLPQTVPTHFDLNGRPNDYSDKSTLIFLTVLFTVLSLGCYLLITNLPKIDPKKTAGQSPEIFQKLGLTIALLMSFINFVITYAATNKSENITKIILPAMGIFFAFMGKYMQDIKPNYFAGFRTPWALENEDNWRETHKLAGSMWMAGGSLITIITVFLPSNYAFIAFMILIVIMSMIPFIYSFTYYKKHQSK